MIQDPYAGFQRVAPSRGPAQPAQVAAQDPYAGFQRVEPEQDLPRQQTRPQPRQQPRQPQMAPQTAPQTIGDTGLTRDEIFAAQRQQGYTDEQIVQNMAELGLDVGQPEQMQAQAPVAMPQIAQPQAPQAPAIPRFKDLSREQLLALESGQQILFDTPNGEEIRTLAGRPSEGATGSEVRPGVFVNEVNPDALAEARRREQAGGFEVDAARSLLQGVTFNLLDELTAPVVGTGERVRNLVRTLRGEEIPYTAQEYENAYRLNERAAEQEFREQNPVASAGFNIAGGLAAPGAGAAGRFIQGAQGAGRIARAGGVGAGYGAAYGYGAGEGNPLERASETAQSALIGAGTGAVAQRLLGGRQGVQRAVSPQRELSREGVDLTLGQMLEPTPVVGGMIRATEDRLAGLPVVGDVIQGARMRTLESANLAGVNRALQPIGETLPKGTKAGFEAVEAAQDALGKAYARVLSGVNLQLDQPLYDDIARVTADAAADMGPQRAQQLGEILQARVFRNVDDANATIGGEEFKRIESVLGQQQRQLVRSLDADQQALGRALGDVRQVFRDALARQNPMEAPRLQDINRGYANLVRMEEAAGAPGSLQREGVATPAQIASAVRRTTGTRSQRARGGGIMTDFAQNVGQVIPSQVPDSGTAGRGALATLLATGGAVLKPEIAIPVIAAAGPYTKAGQTLLNTIYRSTDQGVTTRALDRLGQLAQRDPALLPYYEQAVQQFLPDAPNATQERQRAQQ